MASFILIKGFIINQEREKKKISVIFTHMNICA